MENSYHQKYLKYKSKYEKAKRSRSAYGDYDNGEQYGGLFDRAACWFEKKGSESQKCKDLAEVESQKEKVTKATNLLTALEAVKTTKESVDRALEYFKTNEIQRLAGPAASSDPNAQKSSLVKNISALNNNIASASTLTVDNLLTQLRTRNNWVSQFVSDPFNYTIKLNETKDKINTDIKAIETAFNKVVTELVKYRNAIDNLKTFSKNKRLDYDAGILKSIETGFPGELLAYGITFP